MTIDPYSTLRAKILEGGRSHFTAWRYVSTHVAKRINDNKNNSIIVTHNFASSGFQSLLLL